MNTIARMRFLILAIFLAVTSTAFAAPHLELSDEVLPASESRGFVNRIERVQHAVADRTSTLVVNALGFLGVPYRRGGNDAETGFDCSGFVRAMYDQTVGLVLPRRAAEQAAVTQPVARADMKPGDLVFFNTMRRAFSHVGIYVGEGKFIHSPKPGAQVRVESLSESYWQRRFQGARRVEGAETEFKSSEH